MSERLRIVIQNNLLGHSTEVYSPFVPRLNDKVRDERHEAKYTFSPVVQGVTWEADCRSVIVEVG